MNLTTRDLKLSYNGTSVIQDVSVEIRPGTFAGLVGANGAGKTTLLLALSGQFLPDSGDIFFGDKNIYQNNLNFKRQVGFAPETPFLYPNLTADEFLEFVARIKRIPVQQFQDDVARYAAPLLTAGQRSKLNSELSLGMRKKLVMAAALIGSPKIVFLDEALNGVDFESVYRIKSMLQSFVSGGGMVILSSHVLDVLEKVCSRFLVLHQGRMVADLDTTAFEQFRREHGTNDLEACLMHLIDEARDAG